MQEMCMWTNFTQRCVWLLSNFWDVVGSQESVVLGAVNY